MRSTRRTTGASACSGRRSSSSSRCSTGRWSSCSRARSPTTTRAASRARDHLRVAATIQLGARAPVRRRRAAVPRTRSRTTSSAAPQALYWILIVAVLAYAASYFARGYLAGHHRFELYGGLVLMEASSRCLFALAVTVGIAEGQTAVALGMAAAPIVSLAVVPVALRGGSRRRRRRRCRRRPGERLATRRRRARRGRARRAGRPRSRSSRSPTAAASRSRCC